MANETGCGQGTGVVSYRPRTIRQCIAELIFAAGNGVAGRIDVNGTGSVAIHQDQSVLADGMRIEIALQNDYVLKVHDALKRCGASQHSARIDRTDGHRLTYHVRSVDASKALNTAVHAAIAVTEAQRAYDATIDQFVQGSH